MREANPKMEKSHSDENEGWNIMCSNETTKILEHMITLNKKLDALTKKLDSTMNLMEIRNKEADDRNEKLTEDSKSRNKDVEKFTGVLRDMEGRLVDSTERQINRAIRSFHINKNSVVPFFPFFRGSMNSSEKEI